MSSRNPAGRGGIYGDADSGDGTDGGSTGASGDDADTGGGGGTDDTTDPTTDPGRNPAGRGGIYGDADSGDGTDGGGTSPGPDQSDPGRNPAGRGGIYGDAADPTTDGTTTTTTESTPTAVDPPRVEPNPGDQEIQEQYPEQTAELREDVAGQSEYIDPDQVGIRSAGDGQIEAYIPDTLESRVDFFQREDLREDVAGQSDQFTEQDVEITETDDGLQASIPEETIRSTLREDAAAQSEFVDPGDVEITETGDGAFEASLAEGAAREQAREQIAGQIDAVGPGDITVEQTADGGYELATFSDPDQPGSAQQEFQEFSELDDTVVSGDVQTDSFGQTTDPTYDPDAEQPDVSATDAVREATVGYVSAGVQSLGEEGAEEVAQIEGRVSEAAGFDVGETATTTGETLIDRPLDSAVTGAATIRTGGAVIADDVSEDAAAAGAAVTGTGTATGTGTTVAGALGATGAAAALPAGAAVAGARGVQEEGVTLPDAETAPMPGETVDEVTPTGEQYPDEIASGQGQFTRPEIEVTGETEAAATTTRVPIDDGTLFTSEIEATGETEPGVGETELPVAGGSGTGETASGEATGESVVPGEYPQAGQDFPADPTREYVPPGEIDRTARTGQQFATGFGEGTFGDEERTRREITSEDLADPDELQRQRREDFSEQFEQYQQDVREDGETRDRAEEQFVTIEAGQVEDAEQEFLIDETAMTLATEQAGPQTSQTPDLLPGLDADTATDAEQELGQAPGQTTAQVVEPTTMTDTATETTTVQQTAPAQGYAYPPDYPTEYPSQYGFPTETGTPDQTTGPPPWIPTPEADEEGPEREQGQFQSAEELSGFYSPLSGELITPDE